MAHRLMPLPSFLWEVQNAYSFRKQTSPTFRFLDANWALQLHHYSSTREQYIQIFLKRITPQCTHPHTLFVISTSLAVGNASLCCINNVCIQFLHSTEWCVWDVLTNKIKEHVKESALTFLISIQPKASCRDILYKNTEMKVSGGRADVESLHADLGNLFDQHVEADVTFKCRDEVIYAHRAILSSRCKVFAAMFHADMTESREGIIDITDTDPFTLRHFLRYLYTGNLPAVSLDTAMKLYFLADKYGLEILKQNCVFFMIDTMEVDSLQDNSGANDADNLEMSIRSRLRNIREVLCTDNWKYMNEEQLKMSMDAFDFFVKDIYSELNSKSETPIAKLRSPTLPTEDMK